MKLFRRNDTVKRRPAVPAGKRLYACGDIHGRLDLLDGFLDKVDADAVDCDARQTFSVFLGDFIDRGPNTAHVIERLIQVSETRNAIFLKGNHEEMLLRFLIDPLVLTTWAAFGALPTLMSYGLQPSFQPSSEECFRLAQAFKKSCPIAHIDFLKGLPTSYVCGDYLFVHAGIRPGIALDKQTEDDLIWIREDFLEYDRSHAKIVVHGHTPVSSPEVRSNRINIDTGAYATGVLTCLVLEHENVRFI